MPFSGHEETGVTSFAGQFSGIIAGVPIKKRRLPLIQPSSPLSEEPCSLTEETELLQKEHSSPSQGPNISNACIAGAPIKKRRFHVIQASSSPLEEGSLPEENDVSRKEHSSTSQGSTLSTSSSGLSDSNRNPVFEERKASSDVADANMVQINSNYLGPKHEERNLATHLCTLDVMDSKEKVILNEGYDEKLGSQMIKGNPELLLAAEKGLALNIGADISKKNVQEKCNQESPVTPVVPESTNLSLGLKEHLFPSLASIEIDESFEKMEKAEAVSLELSLSKEEGSTNSLNSDTKSNSDTAHVHSNRANWDLNTTMDVWEESEMDAGSGKTSIDGLKITGVASCEAIQNKAFTISSGLDAQQYKCLDQSNLCLTSCLLKYAKELTVKLNAGSASPTASMSSVVASAGDVNTASFRMVKSEPFDENLKQGLKEANACPVGSLDSDAVKQEFVEHSNVDSFKSSNGSNLKLFDPKFIKSELGPEGSQDKPNTSESKSDQLGIEWPQGSDNCSAMTMCATLETMPISAEAACSQVKVICSAGLSTIGNMVNQLENRTSTEEAHHVEKVSHGACSSAEQQVPLETVAIAMLDDGTELSGPGMKDSIITQVESADPEGCRLKLMNELPSDPRGSEGCVSGEEKITLLADMLEDDSYGSYYDSDDNHAVTLAMDTEQHVEDDDYEDGEVREPLEHSTVEDTICEVSEVEHPDCSGYENKLMEKGMVSGDRLTLFHVEENDNKTVIHSEINSGKDGVDIEMHERSGKVTEKNVCMRELLDAEKPTVASDGRRSVKVLQRTSLDLSERENVSKALETELSSDQATNESHGADVVQCADEIVKITDTVKKTDSDLPKMEEFAYTDDATKDVRNGGNQGRIINLSRAASASSPSKTRSISGRSPPSQAGRDVLSDALSGDKLHRRDEVYINDPRKFSRERHQDMSPRNCRLNFVRGRGRVNNRLDTLCGEWESDHEFSGEFYNGPSQFRGPRPKYASAITDGADMEYNNVAPDGSYVGTGRVGRKPLNDGVPLCRHIASSRRSSRGRESIQMGHRIPRTMSSSRCIRDNGSELVGMRHSEKFMRGFPEDTLDPMFTHPQLFEGLDGRFTRGNRSFSSIHRRGLPRIRLKSPISRSHSPGPWLSLRRRSPRRSPDEFGGNPELTQPRSPLYRVERIRSPDRPVFPGVTRHGSPSYMSRPSNDIRDIDSARAPGHPRSVISSRSPSGRILIRNRRFDVVDSRDRADNDDYFRGPMHSGRLLELNGEGDGDERRFGERRGPVRSFRPPYNGTVGENFHLNAEDGTRHLRFCSDDSDFHERENVRERDFDRRIKGRPANVPHRRTRNIDEQEANYRHGGQVWSDASFDDISRVKRKRF